MSKKVLDALTAKFANAVVRTESLYGDEIAWIKRENLVEVARWLRDDPAMSFDYPLFVTAIDWIDWKPQGLPPDAAWNESKPRFTVCVQLRSLKHRHRIRIKVRCTESDPKCPSLTGLWKAFDWQEREAFDMFGIRFEGHPDLRRIYLYEEFVGYPLRKDYPKEKRQPLVRRPDLVGDH